MSSAPEESGGWSAGLSAAPTILPLAAPVCAVLRSHAEISEAGAEAERLGLVTNPQAVKHWDNVLALRALVGAGIRPADPVIDLGCRSGILLTWLHQLGMKQLSGCDLQWPLPPIRSALQARLWRTAAVGAQAYLSNRARMIRASVENTGLASHSFTAVTSMSVIEHGVDIARFVAEAARLLRPGGTLIISTDYWPTPIELHGLRRVRSSRGADRVLDADAVRDLCVRASEVGFLVPDDLDLSAGEPVIGFAGLNYTFLFLAMRKQ